MAIPEKLRREIDNSYAKLARLIDQASVRLSLLTRPYVCLNEKGDTQFTLSITNEILAMSLSGIDQEHRVSHAELRIPLDDVDSATITVYATVYSSGRVMRSIYPKLGQSPTHAIVENPPFVPNTLTKYLEKPENYDPGLIAGYILDVIVSKGGIEPWQVDGIHRTFYPVPRFQVSW